MNKTILVASLTALVILVAGCAVESNDVGTSELASQSENAIVGGANSSNRPTVAGIEINLPGQPKNTFCSGTLIAPTKVLTASHCVAHTSNPADYRVTFANSYSPADTFYNVVKIAVRLPPWALNETTIAADVAVLTLATSPGAGAPLGGTTWPGQPGVAVGFGRTFSADLANTTLGIKREVGVQISSVGSMIFAGEAGHTICQGDSGGPPFVDGAVVGVLSASQDVCETGPGLWARVDINRDWILAQ